MTIGQIDPTIAAKALRMVMAALSEERYLASWDVDLHKLLWRDMARFPDDDGNRVLRGLSEAAGGWFVWGRDAMEPEFVPMADWLLVAPEPGRVER